MTSFDSLFSMTNGGQLISSRRIELTVVDRCNKPCAFEQIVCHPVLTETEICFDDRRISHVQSGIPIVDLLLDGESILDQNNNILGDTLSIDRTSRKHTRWDPCGDECH